ncbi:MAG: iron-containing alcohol dehydrogenase [Deltaproteobacteria bacterium]|jgi:alcohol dehydrogenase YqhD (iron-dependent ADH family)|nr:iron-containing alcohol dehydrogenase [Deltaproteobacteria bacterium]
MKNFVFHNPTKIIFGKDTITSIGSETAAYGKKALMVYGRESIKKNNIYDQVTEALREAGITIIEHGGVQSNPVLSHVHQGIKLAKENRVDTIVAVGGGSVLDSAKAISAGALVDHDVWKFFIGKKSIKDALPLTCVLTLAASGSEMNSGMVVTNEETEQKFGFANRHLYPKVSILDPCATFTVPPHYTAYGAVDAIAHVLEYYFTNREPYTPVQDHFMEGIVISCMDSCDRVLQNLEDYDARADLMWAATLALNGLSGAGLGKTGFPMHMIEHSLSALYNIAHGAGLSIVMPGWMIYQAQRTPEKFAQFAERVFNITSGDIEEKAAEGIQALLSWFVKIKTPTNLTALHIPIQDIPKIAENAVALAKIWNMKDYTAEKIEEILKLCV